MAQKKPRTVVMAAAVAKRFRFRRRRFLGEGGVDAGPLVWELGIVYVSLARAARYEKLWPSTLRERWVMSVESDDGSRKAWCVGVPR